MRSKHLIEDPFTVVHLTKENIAANQQLLMHPPDLRCQLVAISLL